MLDWLWMDMNLESFSWTVAAGLLIQVVGILCAVHALWHVRTPQGTIGWCLALVAFPTIAVPLYWVLGRNKFHEYRAAMRREWDRDGITEAYRETLEQYRCSQCDQDTVLNVLDRMTGYRSSRGNTVRLLVDGDATYDAMLRAIGEAEHYILFQVYILRDDEVGLQFQEKLIERAQAGVRVCLLYDALGSYLLGQAYVDTLQEAGVEVASFEVMRRWRYPFQLNFRNHRKILVVDGRVAALGGLNVGEEYLGRHRRLSPWRDTHLEIRGPAALAAQMIFVNDWYWARRTVPEGLRWTPEDVASDGSDLILLPSGPTDVQEVCTIYFVHCINAARERLWIATPYFVPDASIVNALAMAVLRGVDVRILIPKLNDSLMVDLASHGFLGPMEQIGVQLFHYEQGFAHQKVFLVDDKMASVGTANLDNRSLRLNFELNALVVDESFAAEVAKMLDDDFARAHPIGPEDLARKGFPFRLGVAASKLFEPVL